MTVLTLALKRQYFEAIRSGVKLEEYRLATPYWRHRLEGKTFESIVLTLGYPGRTVSERRLLRPWRGMQLKTITSAFFGDKPVLVFAIQVNPAPDPDPCQPPGGEVTA